MVLFNRYSGITEQSGRRVPVRDLPCLDLYVAHCITQIEVEVAGEVPHRIAELRELLLQRDALGHGELAVVSRPLALDRPAPAHAVRQMRGRERVDVGIVVALDHHEVVGDQESRTTCAAREEQDGLALFRQQATVNPMHSPEPPVIEGAAALAQVSAWRHRDLEALAQAWLPAIV